MDRQFKGFSNRTLEFFLGLRFNNNKEFFEENRENYNRFVLQPLKDLATDLIPVIKEIDHEFDTRPMVTKTISRINRDIRFSKDKSPYRDHMWIVYKKAEESNGDCFGIYFEILVDRIHYGAGFYKVNKIRMDQFRARVRANPQAFLSIISQPSLLSEYQLTGEDYKRNIAQGLDDAIQPWYQKKFFCLEHSESISEKIMGPELVDQLEKGFRLLKDLYDFIEK